MITVRHLSLLIKRRYELYMTKKVKKPFEKINFSLDPISPITEAQKLAFQSDKNLVLHGAAGTGKTFISMYLGLQSISDGEHRQLIMVRSAVPTRDIGFLPGTEQEKSKVYEVAYSQIATELFQRGDAYQGLKDKGVLKFMTTSYIRALTLSDCVVVIDECQNMTFHELDSIITRAGDNCRLIFSGDFLQLDLNKYREQSGLKDFLKIIRKMPSFDLVEFSLEDIVRSDLVKEYLVTKYSTL